MPKGIVRPGSRRVLFSSHSAPPTGDNAVEAPSNEGSNVPSSIGEASTPSPATSSRRKAKGPNVPNQNKPKRMKHMDILDSCFKHPEITRQAMVILKAHYTEAWPSWKAIPKEQRESMWTQLKDSAKNLAELSGKRAVSITGGGDSVAAVEKAGLADKMGHISTREGAGLELLEENPLSGVLALDND